LIGRIHCRIRKLVKKIQRAEVAHKLSGSSSKSRWIDLRRVFQSLLFLGVPKLRMERSSSVDASPTASRRARGRPRKEAIERQNLAKMLNSNLTNDVSKRFLQKMKLLKV
jgi:hypothetical protein